jgi:hypothetical protein
MVKSTKALLMGRIQMCKTNPSIAHIGLATHGRSIQIGSRQKQRRDGRHRTSAHTNHDSPARQPRAGRAELSLSSRAVDSLFDLASSTVGPLQ